MTDTKTYVRCSGSGRRALRSLMDQNWQQCPVCNRYNWLTPAGYHPAHPADDTERPATGTHRKAERA